MYNLYSFIRYDLLGDSVWIGLRNYNLLLTNDADFRVVIYNTLWWVLISSPLGVISAFLMALLLNTNVPGRSIFFFPSIAPVVVTAFVWQFLLSVQYSAVNSVLQGWG